VTAEPQGNRPAGELAHTIKRAAWRPYYIEKVKVEGVPGTHPAPAFYPEVNDRHPSDRFNADEYFMLGDNSLQSLDSREWGQVPERMLLGRAIWVYWPMNSFSSIR
jgi:signal peptidase I